ncbi:MAG: galactose-1-phosphate uridylyltransferase [Proteobacteria bacterium]|nr:galactose-1-phosphate uridylyltransferase [Pseudomonadota bacterium]
MPEFRFNVLTQEWVIIATERAKRPMEFAQSVPHYALPPLDPTCPFCPGNEHMTSQEVFRTCEVGGSWKTRVIKNKFPALNESLTPTASGDFFQPKIDGFGVHEVIIDSPRHDHGITELPLSQISEILRTYRCRYRVHEQDPRVRHIILFKNNGEKAGSSLMHPHSQLIATPIVSGQVQTRLDVTRHYYEEHHACLMCDMIRNEIEQNARIIYKNAHFVSFLPYAALSSFHTWIFPLEHHAHFGRLSDEQLPALADMLYYILKAQERLLNYPDYNFVIRSAPVNTNDEHYHWYISIIPRLSKTAGFEIGSNIFINGSLPELNALELRNIVDMLHGAC